MNFQNTATDVSKILSIKFKKFLLHIFLSDCFNKQILCYNHNLASYCVQIFLKPIFLEGYISGYFRKQRKKSSSQPTLSHLCFTLPYLQRKHKQLSSLSPSPNRKSPSKDLNLGMPSKQKNCI